jgi:hypothetical protein
LQADLKVGRSIRTLQADLKVGRSFACPAPMEAPTFRSARDNDGGADL